MKFPVSGCIIASVVIVSVILSGCLNDDKNDDWGDVGELKVILSEPVFTKNNTEVSFVVTYKNSGATKIRIIPYFRYCDMLKIFNNSNKEIYWGYPDEGAGYNTDQDLVTLTPDENITKKISIKYDAALFNVNESYRVQAFYKISFDHATLPHIKEKVSSNEVQLIWHYQD